MSTIRNGDHAFAQSLRETIVDVVSTFKVPGAQVAWLLDGSIEQVAHGKTSVDGSAPVRADTRFPLGSITKAFTASLALQLVGDGSLSLDEPIRDVLPAGRCREKLHDVSLRQLLSHTSGLEDVSGNWQAAKSVREYLHCVGDGELLFAPGEYFSYANAGFIIAGFIIEAITGQSWAESVQAYLLDPLEVNGLYFLSEPIGPGVMTHGHVRRPDGDIVEAPSWSLGRALAPAGGLALSAADLLRFVQLHLSGGQTPQGFQLLDPTLVAEMRSSQVAVPDSTYADQWGLGWSLHEARAGMGPGELWFGHGGTTAGSTGYVRANADQGFAIAMLVNCVPADDEWQRLLSALASVGVEVADTWCPSLPDQPQAVSPVVAGHYENGWVRLTIREGDDAYWMEFNDVVRHPLRAVGPDRCLAVPSDNDAPFPVAFLRDRDGVVRYVQWDGRIARRCA
jgi:CubicO group peptidase (beta-lactamase class C family)